MPKRISASSSLLVSANCGISAQAACEKHRKAATRRKVDVNKLRAGVHVQRHNNKEVNLVVPPAAADCDLPILKLTTPRPGVGGVAYTRESHLVLFEMAAAGVPLVLIGEAQRIILTGYGLCDVDRCELIVASLRFVPCM